MPRREHGASRPTPAYLEPGAIVTDLKLFAKLKKFGGSLHLFKKRTQSDFTAANTSSTCPGTLTLRQIFAILPLLSMRNVERSIPMYLRPYMLFSTQEPYDSIM